MTEREVGEVALGGVEPGEEEGGGVDGGGGIVVGEDTGDGGDGGGEGEAGSYYVEGGGGGHFEGRDRGLVLVGLYRYI